MMVSIVRPNSFDFPTHDFRSLLLIWLWGRESNPASRKNKELENPRQRGIFSLWQGLSGGRCGGSV